MKVTILNPDETKKLFYWWGMTSKVCYDTKTNTPEMIGKHCMATGHFSGSRSQYILFQVDDCPRFTIDQVVRHEEGVMKNVQSFRYVNKHNFTYEVPQELFDNPALLAKYHKHMAATIDLYSKIQAYVLKKTSKKERANEQARYVLPMSTDSSFVIGMDIEGLIHFCNTRLCKRTEDKHRMLAWLIRDEVLKILPELESALVANCQKMLYCPEGKHGCGAYPAKDEVKALIEKGKTNA